MRHLLACAAVSIAFSVIIAFSIPPGGVLAQEEDVSEARTPLPEGVTPEVERAIERGLGFLIRTQRPDGSWIGEQGTYPVAMTALSGLALLGSGSTATRGPYAPAIRRAAEYVLRSSSNDGLFSTGYETGSWDEPRPMYGHAFSMMFLAQVLGQEDSLERRDEIREALRRAVDLAARAQSDDGGWYYTPNSRSDEGTLTVTLMQGLRACRDAGIRVEKGLIDSGVKYIEESTNKSDGSVRYRSRGRDEVRHGVTCAAVVALWSAGRYEDPLLKKIVSYMDKYIKPQWNTYRSSRERHATYVQFYLAQAKFLMGGERWKSFYLQQSRLLLGEQDDDGSWLTDEERSTHGVGKVYSSSVALIVLQLPYNRLPIFQR